ncbi:hypothetical protein A6R68_16163, partial [Neotoma lepida]
MMNIKFLTTPYFLDEDLSCSVVELKYTGNASALFILPDESRMQQVEASLQPETLRKWKDSLRPRCVTTGTRAGLAPHPAVRLRPNVPVPQSLISTQ